MSKKPKPNKPDPAKLKPDWDANYPVSMIATRNLCSIQYIHACSRAEGWRDRKDADVIAKAVEYYSGEAAQRTRERYEAGGVRAVAKLIGMPHNVAMACVYRLIKSDQPPGPWKGKGKPSTLRAKKKAAPAKKAAKKAPAKKKARAHA